MAGLDVLGTFSGTGGISANPIRENELRRRLMMQQLAQEAARVQGSQALQSRGLDLQQQSIEQRPELMQLEDQFTRNLLQMKQQFDAEQQQKQNEAITARQQAQIQAAQQAQSSGQEFQAGQSELERMFRGEQAEQSRDLERQRLQQQAVQFQQTFGLSQDKFDFQKDITLRDQGRADRAMEIKQQLADIEQQAQTGLINQRQAQTRLIEKQIELSALELAEAKEDVGLTGEEFDNLSEALSNGEPPSGEILRKMFKSKKGMEAITRIVDMVSTAQEIGLVKGAQKQATELAEAQKEAVESGEDLPNVSPEVNDEVRELKRLEETGDIGDIGIIRLNAYAKLSELANDDSKQAAERARKIRAVLKEIEGESAEDDLSTSLEPGLVDAIPFVWIGKAAARASEETFGASPATDTLRSRLERLGIEPE